MLHYSVVSGISGQIGFPCVVLQCRVWNLRSKRFYVCRITVLYLEFLLVRSNRISVCRITVLCLEYLFVRSARGGFLCVSVESGISICTVSQRMITVDCVTLLSLESPVSQRRISVRRITAWSLEFLLNKE